MFYLCLKSDSIILSETIWTDKINIKMDKYFFQDVYKSLLFGSQQFGLLRERYYQALHSDILIIF